MKKNNFYKDTQDGYFNKNNHTESLIKEISSASSINNFDAVKEFLSNNITYKSIIVNENNIVLLNKTCKNILEIFYGDNDIFQKTLKSDMNYSNFEFLTLNLKIANEEILKCLLYLSKYFKEAYMVAKGTSSSLFTLDNYLQINGFGKIIKDYNFCNSTLALFNGTQELYNSIRNISEAKSNKKSFFTNEIEFGIYSDIKILNVIEVTSMTKFITDEDKIKYPYLEFFTSFCDNFISNTEKEMKLNNNFLPQESILEDYSLFPFYNISHDLDFSNIIKKYIPEYYCYNDLKDNDDLINYDGNFQSYNSLFDKNYIKNLIDNNEKKNKIFDGYSKTLTVSYSDLEYFGEAEKLEFEKTQSFVYSENGTESSVVDNNYHLLANMVFETIKGTEENIYDGFVDYMQSGDEDVQNILLERSKLIKQQKELQQQLNFQSDYLASTYGEETGINAWNSLYESFQAYYKILIKGETQHVENLNFILSDLEGKYKDGLFSVDHCNIAFMILYIAYYMDSGPEQGIKNIIDNEDKYQEYKDTLTGLKSLPGWIETNEIRYGKWKPKLDTIDNEFWKGYSSFYNFAVEEKNPFNSLVKDPGFENMQTLAIKAKERLRVEFNDDIEKELKNAFYGPQDMYNGHSLWTFTNLIADLFGELEKPLEVDLWTSSGMNIVDFLKNAAYEMTSTVLLELFVVLFEEAAGNLGGKNFSLMSFYNDLLMTKKMLNIMTLSDDPSTDTNKLAKEIENIKIALLDGGDNPNSLGNLLEKLGYFAKNGESALSTGNADVVTQLGTHGITDENIVSVLKPFLPESDNDLTGVWNLFEYNIQTWYLIQVYSQVKVSKDSKARVIMHNYETLTRELRSMDTEQKQYAFLSGIKNRVQFLEKEIESGSLKGLVSKSELVNLSNYFPSTFTNKSWNYGESYQQLIKDIPAIFNFEGHKDYQNWLDISSSGIGTYASACLTNKNAIGDLLLAQENSPIIDTVARLLPTTTLLTKRMKVPLVEYLEIILGWYDELMILVLSLIKRLTKDNELKITERITRETYFLLEGNWELRTRSFSTLIDIIFKNMQSLKFCIKTGVLNPINSVYEVINGVKDRLNEIEGSTTTNNKQNIIDDTVIIKDTNTSWTPELDKPSEGLDKETLQKIKDGLDGKTITIVDDHVGSGIIKTPILISPSTDWDPSKKQQIIDTISGGITVIDGDEELASHLSKPGSSIIIIDNGNYGNNLKDLLLPPTDSTQAGAKKQITDSYIKKDLDTIFNSSTDNGIDYSLERSAANRLNEIKNGFGYDDAGHLSSIDFSLINSKLFLNTLNEFNYKDYIDFKYTSIKMFEKF